jgi:hypothetical protein
VSIQSNFAGKRGGFSSIFRERRRPQESKSMVVLSFTTILAEWRLDKFQQCNEAFVATSHSGGLIEQMTPSSIISRWLVYWVPRSA